MGDCIVFGSLARNYWPRDMCLRMRIADGEGSSCPPIVTVKMVETVRNLVHTEEAREA